jgi:Rrf2 family protein
MKLSTRARYALRMVLEIARHGEEGGPVSLAIVSKRAGVSRGYLEQLAVALRNARITRGVAGRHGGFKLARAATEISIGDIVEATIGRMCIVDCLEDPDSCSRASECECRPLYGLINHRIAEVLRSFTIADLLDSDRLNSLRSEVQGLDCMPETVRPPEGPVAQ